MVGQESFGFHTDLQFISDEQRFQLEEHLMVEIKEHKNHLNSQPCSGFIHDVLFIDDNGIIATVSDFKEPGNLEIKRKE